MKIDLIIFDLDGTLLNSIPDLTDSLNHVAKLHSKKLFSETIVTNMVGAGITKLVADAFKLHAQSDNFSMYFNQFLTHYEKNYSNKSYLYKNVFETLDYFKSKKLAILSNKANYLTNQAVTDYKINSYFDIILGATDELAKKPSAEPVNYILNKLNVHPSNAILVGDSEPDIICAKNAGISSVALTSGYRPKSKLAPLNPTFLIDDISKLKSIINI